MPDLGYSIHNKIKPLTWALGPVLAGSGPFVTPLSQQGLAGNTWKQWDMNLGTHHTQY